MNQVSQTDRNTCRGSGKKFKRDDSNLSHGETVEMITSYTENNPEPEANIYCGILDCQLFEAKFVDFVIF